MNILRLIKLKHLNGEFDSLNEKEKYFLSFFNNLEEFTLDNNIYLRERGFDDDETIDMFYYEIGSTLFWCNDRKVHKALENKFDIGSKEVHELIEHVMNDHIQLPVEFKLEPNRWRV